MSAQEHRIRVDTRDARRVWGDPNGVPEGSDFDLVAELTLNGVSDSAALGGGTFVLSLRDSTDSSASLILTDEATDSTSTGSGSYGIRCRWQIADTQSNAWASDSAIVFHGDIRGTESGGSVHYWPAGLVVRPVLD